MIQVEQNVRKLVKSPFELGSRLRCALCGEAIKSANESAYYYELA